MKPDVLEEGTPLQAGADSSSPGGHDILNDVRLFWDELRGLSHARFRLAALETQRAGLNLVAMLEAGVMVAVLTSTAWLGLMAVGVLRLIENGVVTSTAILLAVVLNLLVSLLLCAEIRRKSNYLKFPAIQRSLQPISSKPREEEQV